jgi:hypothetical protein
VPAARRVSVRHHPPRPGESRQPNPPPAAAAVAAGLSASLLRRWRERFDACAREVRALRAMMAGAQTYPEWRRLAAALDEADPKRLGGASAAQSEARLYDKQLLARKLAHLKTVRRGKGREPLSSALLESPKIRCCVHRRGRAPARTALRLQHLRAAPAAPPVCA